MSLLREASGQCGRGIDSGACLLRGLQTFRGFSFTGSKGERLPKKELTERAQVIGEQMILILVLQFNL